MNPGYERDDDDEDDDDDDDDFGLDGDTTVVVVPTAAETVLPWKRDEGSQICQAPLKQREFPSWLKNEDYLQHGSPSDTMMGIVGECAVCIGCCSTFSYFTPSSNYSTFSLGESLSDRILPRHRGRGQEEL